MQLEVRLFGGFDVRIEGEPLPALRSRREQWLLALLVLRQDRNTARDWLATTLWPDNDEAQALFYLRKSLSNLRQALGSASSCLLSPTPRTVRLNLTGAFADVVAFDQALQAQELSKAVALYCGALLPDCLEEWVLPERNAREQAYLMALEALATQAAAKGDPARSVHWLRLLIAADPFRESGHRALMQALADCGDPAALALVYQELRTRLHKDLNALPAPETEALYQQLRQQKAPRITTTPPPPPVGLRRQLPIPLTELIGREREIAEVLDWMKRRRLVTLFGAGGIGKTRLAIAVAEAALPRFDQGAWFVDLAPLSEAALVPKAAAKALGITEEGSRPLIETLTEALATRSLLLVLDNCEHLTDACAELAYSLLSACPSLALIATSRQPLEVTGEQLYRVPSLPTPGPELVGQEKDPHFLMEYDAIRLFVDRAVRVNSAFRLSRGTAPDVVEICRQLDGIPLAIEMAAARLRSFSAGEINSRLSDRFRLLTSGNRGALPRQQTLRAAIDWSYTLLSEPEQALFSRLCVFSEGWTREAVESICCDEALAVGDILTALVDKSLVVSEERHGATRFRLLESIRLYALECLEAAGQRRNIRDKHLDYFLRFAETTRPLLVGPERAHWLSVLETEHDNLRQALAYCIEDPEAGERGLQLSASLWGFWCARGHLSEGRHVYRACLAHPGAQANSKARADALNGAGVLAFYQGDYATSRRLHEEGLAICRERADQKGIGFAVTNLGNVAAIQGEYASAYELYHEGLAIARAMENLPTVSTVLNNLGNIAKALGDYEGAFAFHSESLKIQRELGGRVGVANSLNNLGNLAEVRGDYDTARSLYAESLELHRELGPPTAEASNLASLGNVAFQKGDYPLARSLYEESLALRQKLGDRWGIAISLQGLGATASQQGDYRSAQALYRESLTLRQDLGDQPGMVESLDSLASLALKENERERAVCLWGVRSALAERIGSVLLPQKHEALEEILHALRGSLGEGAFQSLWQEGCTMTMEQALAYALHPEERD